MVFRSRHCPREVVVRGTTVERGFSDSKVKPLNSAAAEELSAPVFEPTISTHDSHVSHIPPDYLGVSSESYLQRIFALETGGSISPLKGRPDLMIPLTSCVRAFDRVEQFSKWYAKCQNRLIRTNVSDAQSGSSVL